MRQPGAWQYGPNNELLAHDTTSYTYDQAGNLIEEARADETWMHEYDVTGRRSAVRKNDQTQGQYFYDPFGRRIAKVTASETIYFHYTDEGLAGEYTSTGEPIRKYAYAPGGSWTTDPVALYSNGQWVYYHNDHLGTPRRITDWQGTTAWAAKAWAFGEVAEQAGATVNRLGFPGQYEDTESGTRYNFHRDYQPNFSRYMQSDPISLSGGTNSYTYVTNNPIIFLDPQGLARVYNQFTGHWIEKHSEWRDEQGCLWFFTDKGHVLQNCPYRATSIQKERTGCKEYKTCIADCAISAVIGVAVEQLGTKVAYDIVEAAAEAAEKKALKAIVPVVGQISTVSSIIGSIECAVDCHNEQIK